MGLNRKYKLGELIRQLDERNYDNEYGVESVRGISTDKQFIDTKANMAGVKLDSYKLVHKQEFAYVADTSRRGDKIALAYNNDEESFLISSIYTVFSIYRTDLILPEYLFMFFNRSEFDRLARFSSWGSAREMFSWEDLCSVQIELPSISTQQKAVNIYNGLKENLAAYESGLEDLKLTCDGFIDDLKHHAPKEKIVNLLHEVDNRNEEVGITDVKGINIDKQFMPTIAKIDESSLGKYKIVKPGQFAFSGMQTGRDCCIRIALLSGRESVIVSPAYTTLEIKENIVIPEYIMLWFSREESDRYGWFASDGSVRSNLDLDRFYGIEIPLPDIKIQRVIADIYSCYIERKRIAEELKEQLKNICPLLLRGAIMAGN